MEAQSKGGTVHYVQFKQDNKDLICIVSPGLRLWHQLEIGKSYEVSISHSRNKCFIYTATEVDTKQLKF